MVTYLEAIIDVLADAGGPLNYGEIAKRALERGLIPKTGSMRSNVSKIITTHLAPPKQRFVKVGRGIYDLSPGSKTNSSSMPRPRRPRVHSGSQHIDSMAPSMEYREYMYNTKYGTLVKGQINKGIKFMFCEKNKDLFVSGLKGEKEVTSALYALLDAETKNVYVGITRRGYRRITDHWKNKFTHLAMLFSEEKWSTDLRTNLECDLTDSFKLLPWNPTNQVEPSELDESDKRTRTELLPLLKQIATRTHTLVHYTSLLYPDHSTGLQSPNDENDRPGKKPTTGKNTGSKKPRPPIFSTNPAIRHHWIWSCPENIYEIVQSQAVWASQVPLENISARVRKGNLVAFYVKERKAFSGVYEFMGEWYTAPHVIWPDEMKEKRIIHTSQIRLKRIRVGHAALDVLKPRLEIFRTNTSGNIGHVLRSSSGYPGNRGRPITESDMQIISDSMRPVGV